MIKFLPKHPLYSAFDSFTEVVPMVIMSKCAFSAFRPSHNYQEIHLNLVDDSLVVLTKEKFILTINLGVLPSTKFHTPSTTNVFTTLYQMGYQKKLKGVAEFKRNQLPSVWQFVCHYVIRCLSGRTGCTNNMGIFWRSFGVSSWEMQSIMVKSFGTIFFNMSQRMPPKKE